MDTRIAVLEAHVAHVQSDLTEVKGDVRRANDKLDHVISSVASAKVWALLLYVGLAASLLLAMARGFKWI